MISPSRRINGIIAFLGPNFEFTNDKPTLHNIFYKLAQEKKYESLFEDIHFIERGDYHKSSDIISIMDNLMTSQLIKFLGLDKYQVSKGFNEIYTNKANEFFKDKVKLIKEASEKFKQYLTQ